MTLVLAALAASAGAILVASAQSGSNEPTEGEERASQADVSRKSDILQAELVEDFNESGTAYTLHRVSAEIDYPAPPQTLSETISASTLIVVGTVTSQRFEFLGQSIVLNRATLEVDRALAGELAGSSPEVSFTQFGGPELGVVEGGHRHPWLVQAEADPLLLPGDRVLLILSRSEIDGVLRVVPWSGQITFVDQRARVLEGSPLHGQLNGLTEALTIDLVLAAVAAKP